ncbi:MAG: hypothetical protein M3N26_02760 [Pseudomonadota bacterium]|nr:hypothetical protein [Pseudomonadota bacterium]
MHATILGMISTNSLTAFSAATLSASAAAPKTLRLVREQSQPGANSPATKNAQPNGLPSVAPPRGSFVNLSV